MVAIPALRLCCQFCWTRIDQWIGYSIEKGKPFSHANKLENGLLDISKQCLIGKTIDILKCYIENLMVQKDKVEYLILHDKVYYLILHSIQMLPVIILMWGWWIPHYNHENLEAALNYLLRCCRTHWSKKKWGLPNFSCVSLCSFVCAGWWKNCRMHNHHIPIKLTLQPLK